MSFLDQLVRQNRMTSQCLMHPEFMQTDVTRLSMLTLAPTISMTKMCVHCIGNDDDRGPQIPWDLRQVIIMHTYLAL